MLIFLDTETTGNGPDDRICQIAFKPEGGQPVCELFNPGMPISIEVMPPCHQRDGERQTSCRAAGCTKRYRLWW